MPEESLSSERCIKFPLLTNARYACANHAQVYDGSGLSQGPFQRTVSTPLRVGEKSAFANIRKVSFGCFDPFHPLLHPKPTFYHVWTHFRILTKPILNHFKGISELKFPIYFREPFLAVICRSRITEVIPAPIFAAISTLLGSRFLSSGSVRVLGRVVFSLCGCQTPAQHRIKILHPWVQEFYPILGLGCGRRVLRHFQIPTLHWIHFSP